MFEEAFFENRISLMLNYNKVNIKIKKFQLLIISMLVYIRKVKIKIKN